MGSWTRPRRAGLLVLAALILGFGTGGKKDVYESRATAHYKLGMRYYQEAEYRGAVNELQSSVELVPKNPDYRVALGLAYMAVENFPLAEEQFLRALKLNPLDTEIHNYLGMVYGEMKDYTRAEEEYRRALADPGYLTPENSYLNWGIMLRQSGDLLGAERMMRKALEVSPRYVRAHYELGQTLAELGRPAEALTSYLTAWEAMSQFPALNIKIAEIYMELGKRCEARPYLEKVMVIAPESDEAATARTYLLSLPDCSG